MRKVVVVLISALVMLGVAARSLGSDSKPWLWLRSLGLLTGLLAAIILLPAPSAHAKTAVSTGYAQVGNRAIGANVLVKSAPGKARIVIETKRFGRGARNRARSSSKRLRKSGRQYLRITAPRGVKTVIVRVRVTVRSRRGKTKTVAKGRWEKIRFSKSGRTAKVARVRLSDITDLTAPTGESSGELSVRGGSASRIRRGRVVAMGITSRTPYGMLARVTSVSSSSNGRVATLEPASISDVVPAGAIDLTMSADPVARVSATQSSQRTKSILDCSASRTATATALAEVSAGLSLSAGWTGGGWFKMPKLTADATGMVQARLEGSISLDGEASCELTPQTLFPSPVRLAAFTVWVGMPPVPVPVVIEGQVTLTGSAKASGSLSAGISANASASAGVRYSGGNFVPHSSFIKSFNAQPPTVRGTGEARVDLSPSLSVRLAGAAGPDIDLTGGLKLSGDLSAQPGQPWWTLTAPLSLGAKFRFDLWLIHAESPRYTMWEEEPVILQADSSTGAPGSQIIDEGNSPDPLPPGVRTRLTWDSDTDVDLHTWNQYGAHSYFNDLNAIDGGYLDQDVIPGYGPETFYETDPALGNQFTFGVCQYSGVNSNGTVDVRDPSGNTRRYAVVLRGTKAAALLTTSPPGGAPYIDYDADWCSEGTDPTSIGQVTTGSF